MTTATHEPVLFFDAECGLCDRAVRLLLWADRNRRLRFAALGGATWQALVPEPARRTLPDSAVLRLPDGRLLSRSTAILGALREAGGPWALLAGLARLAPRSLADRLYDVVARGRSATARIPGGPASCPLPPGRSRRFLP
jgi:predicted DCC family thiol-disulfide oxidoreductase YuxK